MCKMAINSKPSGKPSDLPGRSSRDSVGFQKPSWKVKNLLEGFNPKIPLFMRDSKPTGKTFQTFLRVCTRARPLVDGLYSPLKGRVYKPSLKLEGLISKPSEQNRRFANASRYPLRGRSLQTFFA